MTETVPAYGLWSLVIINSAIFIFFAFSFIKPKTRLDWKSLGVFSAFIVALFVEMYGFPLTIYFLSGWLQARFPEIDPLAHGSGHLWYTLFGFRGNPHLNPIHLVSNILIFAGFYLTYRAWLVLHEASKQGLLAVTGPYAVVRHPQYVGFILVMTGFLIMWPTILTLVMFPVLLVVYVRLARLEERQVRKEFGDRYDEYAARVPGFIPKRRRADHVSG
ncbi:MAG: isoprenylcysteine carboxylmethyltransferase family protein [Desulfobulbaceae bacterium]